MLSMIIPTINERENLETLLPLLKPYAQEIIIVDDGSTDGTVEVARRYGCKTIERGRRLGVGSAVYEGVKQAKGDIVAVMDADRSHPTEVLKSIVLIELGLVDIIKFSRFIEGGRMEDKGRHFLMRYYNRFLARVAGVHTQDFTGGYLAAKKETFDYPQTAIHGEWNLEYMSYNRKKRVAEIPYLYRRRVSGKSNWSGKQDFKRIFHYLYFVFVYRWKALCEKRWGSE